MRCRWSAEPPAGPPGGHRQPADRGMVTAEAALVLPVLAVVLGGCLYAETAVAAQLRCLDAARIAARAVARGDPWPAAQAAALAAAPAGASVGEALTADQ